MFRFRALVITAALAVPACATPAASAAAAVPLTYPTSPVVVSPTASQDRSRREDEDRLSGVLFRFNAGSSVHAAPAVGPDGSVYIGTGDGYVQALYPDGSLKWSFTVEGAVAWPPVLDGTEHLLVATAAQRLYSINTTGTLAWQVRPPTHVSTELVLGPGGSFVFGGTDGAIWAYSTHSTALWHTPLADPISGAPAVRGHRLVAGTDAGTLWLLEGAVQRPPVRLGAPVHGAPAFLADGSALVVAGTELLRVDASGRVVSRRADVEWFSLTSSGLVLVTSDAHVLHVAEGGAETSLGVLPSRASAPPVETSSGVVAVGTEAGELCFLGGSHPRRVSVAHAVLHRPVLDEPRGRVFAAAGNGVVAAVSVVPLVE